MQEAAVVLSVLRERGRKGLPLTQLYRQMFNTNLYLLFVDRTTRRHAGGGGCAGRASAGRNHATLSREDAWCCRVDSSSGTTGLAGDTPGWLMRWP